MSNLVLESDTWRREWIIIWKFDENRRVSDLRVRAAHNERPIRLHVKGFDDNAKVFGSVASDQLFVAALPRADSIKRLLHRIDIPHDAHEEWRHVHHRVWRGRVLRDAFELLARHNAGRASCLFSACHVFFSFFEVLVIISTHMLGSK